MKLITQTIPSDCDIALAGDIHHGTSLCHKEGVAELVDWVASGRNRRLALLGDLIEAIATDDKRYQLDSTDQPIPLLQCNDAIATLKPIAKKILVSLEGNHEGALHRFGSLGAYIAENLQVPFGTFTSRLTMADKRGTMMRFYLCHGFGTQLTSNAKDPEQALANMKATLKMRLKHKAGDCVLMAAGHTHKLIVVDPHRQLYITESEGKLKQSYTAPATNIETFIDPDRRWYVNTGSFLRLFGDGVSGYAERFGMNPVELGWAVAEIRDRKLVNVRRVVLGM